MSTALGLVALVALSPAKAAALEIAPVYTIHGHTFASEDAFGTAIAAVPPYVLVGKPQAEDGEDTADLVDFVTGAHVRTFGGRTLDCR